MAGGAGRREAVARMRVNEDQKRGQKKAPKKGEAICVERRVALSPWLPGWLNHGSPQRKRETPAMAKDGGGGGWLAV